MAVPACEMASRAYSTWYRRPSGEKMVVYRSRLAWWESFEVLELQGPTYSGIVTARHDGFVVITR